MRILIFTDGEGGSGIDTKEIIESPDPTVFAQARALITAWCSTDYVIDNECELYIETFEDY